VAIASRTVKVSRIAQEQQVVPVADVAKQLARLAEIIEENFPTPEDKSAYVSDVITVPPSSQLTVTWEFFRGWKYYVAHLYADVAPECGDYAWILYQTGEADIEVFHGNKHAFTRRKILIHEPKVVFTMKNFSQTTSYDIDIYIDMWARRW